MRQIPSGNCTARFSPDGKWLLVCGDKEYSQYAISGHPTNWVLIRQFPLENRGFNAGQATFSADGKLLALDTGLSFTSLIETATGRELARLPFAVPNFSHNNRWVAVPSETGLRVWDLARVRSHLHALKLDWGGPPDLPQR